MGEVPGETAPKLEPIENSVTRFEEIRTDLSISFEQCAQPAASFVGERRSECGRGQANEMLEAIASSVVCGEPGTDHKHAGRVHDGIEGLVIAEPRPYPQGAVETFSDVLDAHFVGERPVGAGVDHGDVVTALLENALPHSERRAFVGISVDENQRIARHWRKYIVRPMRRRTSEAALYFCRCAHSLQRHPYLRLRTCRQRSSGSTATP